MYIVVGVLGGALLFAVLIIIVLIVKRRRRKIPLERLQDDVPSRAGVQMAFSNPAFLIADPLDVKNEDDGSGSVLEETPDLLKIH